MLSKVETFILNSAEGGLKYQRRNGEIYYYQQKKNIKTKEWERSYIRKNQRNLAKELAQKGYFLSVKSVLKKQLHLLQRFIKEYDEEGIEQIYRKMPEERKALVEPTVVSVKEKIEAWNNEEYEPYLAFSENMIYETEKGEMVRSKSEVGRIYYYEHAGRIDEPKYVVDFVKKMNLYSSNNILQGCDLMVTYETYSMPLDIGCVKKVVKSILDEGVYL